MEAVDIEKDDFKSPRDQIPMKRDLSVVLQLRGKERMEAILSSDAPREVFQSMPEEEAYFTIKEIGEQDALPLLSLMSPEQCQYLLDLELWKGYEVQLEKVERWLPLLLSCDEQAVGQWLRSIDVDTLVLILKKTIRIFIKESEESILAQNKEDSHFTLDGTYYIEVLKPSLQSQIEQLLKTLADSDLNLYWRVLNQANWEIKAELEERALRFREARLEDKGFPPMEEALSLYQYLNPKRLQEVLEEKEVHLPGIPEETSLLSLPMVLKDQNMFFSSCLRELEGEPLIDRLKMELTYMANQVMVADQPERIDISTIHGSLKKVGGYLSIGLELLSEGSVQRAREWIEQIPLKFVFQVGFGASLELKWRAEKVWQHAWFSEKGIPPSFLGSPWGERIEGLLKKKPLFYDDGVEMGYREFRSLEEIRSVGCDLDKIELVGKILSSFTHVSYSDGLLWKTVILAAFVHDQWGLSPQEIPHFLEKTMPWINKLCREKGNIKESLSHWLSKKSGIGPEDQNLMEIVILVLEDVF